MILDVCNSSQQLWVTVNSFPPLVFVPFQNCRGAHDPLRRFGYLRSQQFWPGRCLKLSPGRWHAWGHNLFSRTRGGGGRGTGNLGLRALQLVCWKGISYIYIYNSPWLVFRVHVFGVERWFQVLPPEIGGETSFLQFKRLNKSVENPSDC